jgi:HNH endonuclease
VPRVGERQGLAGILNGVDDVKTDEPGSLAVAPWPPHPHDNWLEILEAGAVGGFTGAFGNDVYSGVKAACQAAVKKFRDQQSDPDEEREYLHQLVAEAFIGPCPPGRKLVHLNGDGLDNRRANLAYVPESDPRPAAPLNPRPPGWPTKNAAVESPEHVGGRTQHPGKKKRKGKKKRHLQLPWSPRSSPYMALRSRQHRHY